MRRILNGNKVYFKLIEAEDLKKRVVWLNDPDVQKTLHYDFPTSLARTKKWFDGIVLDRTRVEFSVFDLRSDEHIGFCGLLGIDVRVRKAEFHAAVGEKKFWGGGYGTEIYKLLVNYGFLELGLNRIYGYQNIDNEAAYHVVSKLGWKKEGTFRQDLFAHGRLYDRNVVAILRHEWESCSEYDF